MKSTENYMTVTFSAKSENEAFARNAVAIFCVSLDPTVEWISDIKTAVSEAVTNSVVHAYPDNNGEITVKVKIDDDTVHIEVIDSGIGIDDVNQARQPFYTTKPQDERSGMGFTVMESFMDDLAVERNPVGGTIVKMSKRICTR